MRHIVIYIEFNVTTMIPPPTKFLFLKDMCIFSIEVDCINTVKITEYLKFCNNYICSNNLSGIIFSDSNTMYNFNAESNLIDLFVAVAPVKNIKNILNFCFIEYENNYTYVLCNKQYYNALVPIKLEFNKLERVLQISTVHPMW